MKVKELKKLLEKFDDETEVVIALKYDAVKATPLVRVDPGKYVPEMPGLGFIFPKDDPGKFGSSVREVTIFRGQW